MKKIFIYYSLTGNGDIVANCLSKFGYEIRKVITNESLPQNYMLRILTGGYKAMVNYCDVLIDFDNDISKYEEIVIGSPVWNDRLSSPINSVIKELDLRDKKVKFILYSGSGKIKKAKEIIYNNFRSEVICLKEPKDNMRELDKLKKFNIET